MSYFVIYACLFSYSNHTKQCTFDFHHKIQSLTQELKLLLQGLGTEYKDIDANILFRYRCSLCSPGWPGICYVYQVGLKLTALCFCLQNSGIKDATMPCFDANILWNINAVNIFLLALMRINSR